MMDNVHPLEARKTVHVVDDDDDYAETLCRIDMELGWDSIYVVERSKFEALKLTKGWKQCSECLRRLR